MQIGLLSDTHDNLQQLLKALDIFQQEKPDLLIHCGDITDPETISLVEGFPLYCVFGNMDAQREELRRAVQRLHPENRAEPMLEFDVGSHRIAVVHGDHRRTLQHLIDSGDYAYVFHGHTHRRRDERVGSTHVVNPGALSGARWGPASVALLDVERDIVRFIDIP